MFVLPCFTLPHVPDPLFRSGMDTWDTFPTGPEEMSLHSEGYQSDHQSGGIDLKKAVAPPKTKANCLPEDNGPFVCDEGDDEGWERAREALKLGLPVIVMPAIAPSPTPVPPEAPVLPTCASD